MIKAVFIDYTGTTVMEGGPDMKNLTMRVCKNSNFDDPKEMMSVWWKIRKRYEADSYQDKYLTSEEILHKSLEELVNVYGLKDDIDELHKMISSGWINAPLFPDAKEFYDKCPFPLFVITNNSENCVNEAMRINDLHPTGIVSADSTRACKPHKELFEKALEIAGCKPEEVIHIGDSFASDVLGARSAGIKPILVQRKEKQVYDDLIVVDNLKEVLKYLNIE